MDLLIVGASARAAAFSAIRAGVRPVCIDLFADEDLALASRAISVAPDDYPDGLADLAESLGATSWMYTGGLENRPDLIERISRRHALLGNSPEVARAARDPFQVERALREAGLPWLEVRRGTETPERPKEWLDKPLASAGGRGIRPSSERETGAEARRYLQRRAFGRHRSAAFVGDARGARLLGITRQLIGLPGRGMRFAHRGNIVPVEVADRPRARIEAAGAVLADAFGLEGLFGLDFVLSDDIPWITEINPRYTASIELLEFSMGRSLLAEHLAVFGRVTNAVDVVPRSGAFGKSTVFARGRGRFPDVGDRLRETVDRLSRFTDGWKPPEFADVPAAGTEFREGDPVLSVFAEGENAAECRAALARKVREWSRRLGE